MSLGATSRKEMRRNFLDRKGNYDHFRKINSSRQKRNNSLQESYSIQEILNQTLNNIDTIKPKKIDFDNQDNVETKDQFDKDLLNQIEQSYMIENSRVKRFLREKEILLPVIIDSKPKLEKEFAQAEFSLDISCDRESEDSESIIIKIKTDLEVTEAIEKLDRIKAGWWGEKTREYGSEIFLNIDYI